MLNLVIMVLSLSVHEFAHAVVADRLGDDTPRSQGRLTLSPLAHYDVFGTILIPIIGTVLGGIAFIGWARPVQTLPGNYTRKVSMRTGTILVSIAGPASNLALAILAMAAYAVLVRVDPAAVARQDTVGAVASLLYTMVLVNIGLCVFNMLPLPPLDGARLLPRSMDEFQQQIAPFSFIIIMIILNVPTLRNIFWWPVGIIGGLLHAMFGVHSGPIT